jgi:anthranilate phosphoribosyltransferase
VIRPALLERLAGALLELGHERAMVVHGEPGLDEISPLGPTEILEVEAGQITRRTLDPERDLGWPRLDATGLEGGDREANARRVLAVLRGDLGGAARAATVLNAGAAIWAAGAVDGLVEGIGRAEDALASGAGLRKLEELREATSGG